jgi:acetyl-CoA carboxylase carboxyltransferase component
MCGRAYDPRFVFTWPSARSSVMGAQQLADVSIMVSRASALGQGKPFDEEGARVVRHAIEQQITAESMPAVLSGLVYDDGIIDPRDTRDVLGLALSAIHTAEVKGTDAFGVFRM